MTIIDEDGDEELVSVPSKYEVCWSCEGKGSMVNPAIDGNGISPEEFHDDPGFAEEYFSGVYDIVCPKCKGQRVIEEVDVENLPDHLRNRVEKHLQDEADYQAELAFEQRMRDRGMEW